MDEFGYERRVRDLVSEPDARAAMKTLSVEQRAVLGLTYWQDLTPAEVAEELGIRVGTVKRHLARGRAQLRKILTPDELGFERRIRDVVNEVVRTAPTPTPYGPSVAVGDLDAVDDSVESPERSSHDRDRPRLADQILLERRITELLSARRPHELIAVLAIAVTGTMDIAVPGTSDALYHDTEASMFNEIGARLAAEVGSDGMAARLGQQMIPGEMQLRLGPSHAELACVIPGLDSPDEALDVAVAVLDSLSRPVTIHGRGLKLRASIGVALAPADGTDSATLLRRADLAQLRKKGKRGVAAYEGSGNTVRSDSDDR
jgi:GGDEF domain-containing protein